MANTGPFLSQYLKLGWGYTRSGATITGGTWLQAKNIPVTLPEIVDMQAGRQHVGGPIPGNQRPGARYFHVPGVIYDLLPQADATTRFPQYELLKAAGFSESGSFAYTLADPHLDQASDTPDGNLVPLALSSGATLFGYLFDTELWEANDVICNVSFNFVGGEIPELVVDFFGNIPSGTSTTASGRTLVTRPVASAQTTDFAGPMQAGSLTFGGFTSVACIHSCSIAVNNVIPVRKSLNAAHGVAQFRVARQMPVADLYLDMGQDTLETYRMAGTTGTLSFDNGLAAGDGALCTVSMGVRVVGIDINDTDGFGAYRCTLEMNPAGALSLTWS